MKDNLKVGIVIAGAVVLAAAFPLLLWKLTAHTAAGPAANAAGRYLATKQMAFAGRATPEATLQTIAWAAINGDGDKAFACFSPEMQADISNKPNERRKFNANIKNQGQLIKGLQITAWKMLADDKVELKFKLDTAAPPPNGKPIPGFRIQPMVKIGGEWKLDGSTKEYTPDWDDGSQPEPTAP